MASVGLEAVADTRVRNAVDGLSSSFQRRMLTNDLDKTTLSIIGSTPHDVLLLDFIDERFNLALTGSTLFSLSGELERSGLDMAGRSRITPDGDVFFALWTAGLGRLLSSVDKSRVVLNRVYWAEYLPDGSDASSPGWIRRSNAVLQHLYDTVDAYWGLPCIDYPRESLVADPDHRWGLAPFHYTAEVYRHTLAELERLTANIADAA